VSETANVTWLTREVYDRLQGELEELRTVKRPEIAQRIEDARQEGDLKENGGYHAAREEQAKQEAEIERLEHLLRNAQIGEAPADDGVVEPGMIVTVDLAGSEMVFLLASREMSSHSEHDVFSTASPLGTAVNGKNTGDEVSYTAPNGKEITVKIKEAKPYAG